MGRQLPHWQAGSCEGGMGIVPCRSRLSSAAGIQFPRAGVAAGGFWRSWDIIAHENGSLGSRAQSAARKKSAGDLRSLCSWQQEGLLGARVPGLGRALGKPGQLGAEQLKPLDAFGTQDW